MVLDSSRQNCLIKVPRMISILCAMGSFILSVCLLIIETAFGYHVIHVGWKRCVGNMNTVVDVVATVDLDVLAYSDGIHNWLIELPSSTSWVHHRYIGLEIYQIYKYPGRYANLDPETYGFCPPRGMGYGLSRTYGIWCANPRPPTWWTQNAMGFQGLWVIRSMGYEGFNCMQW